MNCPGCGATIDDDATFCKYCGASTVDDQTSVALYSMTMYSMTATVDTGGGAPRQRIFCEHCGFELEETDLFCLNCGVSVSQAPLLSQPQSPIHVVLDTDESGNLKVADPLKDREDSTSNPDNLKPVDPKKERDKSAINLSSSKKSVVLTARVCGVAILVVAAICIAFAFGNSQQTSDNSCTNSTTTSSNNASREGNDSNTSNVTNSNDAATDTSDYILPDSASHTYTTAELESLSNRDLCLARNEIYARHGYTFENQSLQAYFNKKSWYTSLGRSQAEAESEMTEAEMKNKDTIMALEKSRGSEYMATNITIE